MTSIDESDLIERFKKGDRTAFEAIILRHQDRIYTLCRYMLQDARDAQDAAQDCFLKAYRGLTGFRPESSLYTWLYRIAVNTCLDYRRKSRRMALRGETLTEDLPSDEPSPNQRYESGKTAESIQLALQRLPEKPRAAIVLREMEGLSYEEIAQVLHTSVGTVRSRIARARGRLRHLLKKNVGRLKIFAKKSTPRSFDREREENMKCRRATKWISPYVDDELGADERKAFESHILICASCREGLEEARTLEGLFASARRFPAPYGFAARVLGSLEEKEGARLRGLLRLGPFIVRTAQAGFALALITIGILSGNLLVAEKTNPMGQAAVQESFSLDLFQAAPPDSIGGIYTALMRPGHER